ncbi:hypothetical protein PMAC_000250 [Pneumocystis sp. 'macacae']|nr:hypothetical protein PMAC_000250 [Pneumocystis sp. 'macacae']
MAKSIIKKENKNSYNKKKEITKIPAKKGGVSKSAFGKKQVKSTAKAIKKEIEKKKEKQIDLAIKEKSLKNDSDSSSDGLKSSNIASNIFSESSSGGLGSKKIQKESSLSKNSIKKSFKMLNSKDFSENLNYEDPSKLQKMPKKILKDQDSSSSSGSSDDSDSSDLSNGSDSESNNSNLNEPNTLDNSTVSDTSGILKKSGEVNDSSSSSNSNSSDDSTSDNSASDNSTSDDSESSDFNISDSFSSERFSKDFVSKDSKEIKQNLDSKFILKNPKDTKIKTKDPVIKKSIKDFAKKKNTKKSDNAEKFNNKKLDIKELVDTEELASDQKSCYKEIINEKKHKDNTSSDNKNDLDSDSTSNTEDLNNNGVLSGAVGFHATSVSGDNSTSNSNNNSSNDSSDGSNNNSSDSDCNSNTNSNTDSRSDSGSDSESDSGSSSSNSDGRSDIDSDTGSGTDSCNGSDSSSSNNSESSSSDSSSNDSTSDTTGDSNSESQLNNNNIHVLAKNTLKKKLEKKNKDILKNISKNDKNADFLGNRNICKKNKSKLRDDNYINELHPSKNIKHKNKDIKDIKDMQKKRKEAPIEADKKEVKKNKINTKENNQESTTIFVGGLSWNIDDNRLAKEFENVGTIVSSRVITNRNSGKSKGFGYIEFSKPEEAQAALVYSGKEIDGRVINIDISTKRSDVPKDTINARANKYGDVRSPKSDTLFIGNLSFKANEEAIRTAFCKIGKILGIRLPADRETGRLKGFGYIQFSTVNEAEKAIEMNGHFICGRPIRLDFSTSKDNNNTTHSTFNNSFGDYEKKSRKGFQKFNNLKGKTNSTNRSGFNEFSGKKTKF